MCIGQGSPSPAVQTEGSPQVTPIGLKASEREVASPEVAKVAEVVTEGYPCNHPFGYCSNVPATPNGEIG